MQMLDETTLPDYVLSCAGMENAVRWSAGERLEQLIEGRCALLEEGHPAVTTAQETLTYGDLDLRANQLAHYLRRNGVAAGDRIGLLLDNSVWRYVALLGVLKAGAVYVPLDCSFPRDRMHFIRDDAGVSSIVTLASLDRDLADTHRPIIYLDMENESIGAQPQTNLAEFEASEYDAGLAYIIYTSGTTGHPKGVAVEHASICNFVKVAGEVYGLREDDRVYQGMTIAFDFSVEEIWVPLWVGATLIPSPSETKLVGHDLADFLKFRAVTALCCVPTLLATLDEDLPELRFLLVSGEACPQNLVSRWHAPGRRFLNAYGPTEATVTASLATPRPDKPVNIGQPLPTYSVVILDPERDSAVAPGESGEIGIAGIGLARGYINRDAQTTRVFIPDFIGIPENPSRRIYRTGDLGRINESREIEYLGRIDNQVKLRGYRIELAEIEAALLQIPQIAVAVVNTYELEPGTTELVAYYTLKKGAENCDEADIAEALQARMPPYMVPVFYEHLPSIPMLPSNKADRKALPRPRSPRFIARNTEFVAPSTELEQVLANTLAKTMQVDRVSATDHFFEHLGAHSLLMAQFCTALRDQSPGADVSMRDVYLHPSISQLARCLESRTNAASCEQAVEEYRVATNLQYFGCGALQLITYGVYLLIGTAVLIQGAAWTLSGSSWFELFTRSFVFLVALFALSSALPIAVKWVVIGAWKADTIPIWSLAYFRFWLVKGLISNNPLVLFKGQPLFNLYLRLLGARIGKHAVLDVKHVPVCTDLLDVGDGALVRKDAFMVGYRAQSGYIHTGPVSIGKNAYVGEGAVLDIRSTMEDNSQLGHASSLLEGQTIPASKQYHGSPAQETTCNYCTVPPKNCSTVRRNVYTALQLANPFILFPILVATIVDWGRQRYVADSVAPWLANVRDSLSTLDPLVLSLVLFFGLIALRMLVVVAVPRLLNLFLIEERVYVLFGVHYWITQLVRSTSNSKFLNILFGDSSAVVHYLKAIGYDLSERIVQSGSNFGVEQKHDNPLLCSFGSGTMVADGLSMINIQMSSSSFALRRTVIGADNYIGNDIHYPPDGKTGDNCLLATKVMIPIDGERREGVGLLGSPCFEIPRIVERDRVLTSLGNRSLQRDRLRKKNIHNLITILSFLFCHWVFLFVSLHVILAAVQLSAVMGYWALPAAVVVLSVLFIAYFIAVERLSMKYANLRPNIAAIYDETFWRVERYWKHSEDGLKVLFGGTPFKNVVTRLSGAKIGKKVFDDGMALSEKPLVEIGDYCTFNVDTGLQSHSLEEGVFKCDYIKLGKGCTVGINALVHYGTVVGDNV
ncbi:MAG: Pls/PosA family non-ribosomal peptide synthetase, partial [Gammaproteobacteria bacterium]